MLQNNELMKKTDSIEEVSKFVIKKQRRRSQSRGSKKGTKASSENIDWYYCKQSWHMKKNCFRYKEMLKKKGGPGTNEASIV